MAVSPINLCADLQAWHSAGLSFLYFPGVEARALLNAPKAPRPLAPAKAQDVVRSNDSVKNISPESQGVSQSISSAVNVANNANFPNPNSKLPAHWEAVLAKVKPAPVVWTYKELGEDLFVKGNPERSQALKELIGGLGLKGGTSTFLPVEFPGSKADGTEAWCFGALLERLNGRILVSFGPEALALSPYASLGLAPFHEKIVQGRMVLCLPSFSDILSRRERFDSTKVFLRSAFSKINIL